MLTDEQVQCMMNGLTGALNPTFWQTFMAQKADGDRYLYFTNRRELTSPGIRQIEASFRLPRNLCGFALGINDTPVSSGMAAGCDGHNRRPGGDLLTAQWRGKLMR